MKFEHTENMLMLVTALVTYHVFISMVKNKRQTSSDAALTKYIHLSHFFCCFISSLPISPLLSQSCVSLSRPPSERCLLILECAAGLPALIGGLSDHLFHAAFPHSLSGRAAGFSCRWCFPPQPSLCYILPYFLFSPVLQLLTIDGHY